jgi:hypothetical protein
MFRVCGDETSIVGFMMQITQRQAITCFVCSFSGYGHNVCRYHKIELNAAHRTMASVCRENSRAKVFLSNSFLYRPNDAAPALRTDVIKVNIWFLFDLFILLSNYRIQNLNLFWMARELVELRLMPDVVHEAWGRERDCHLARTRGALIDPETLSGCFP